MNDKLFAALYDELIRKHAFEIQDTTAIRSVRVVRKALCQNRAPMILVEAVNGLSAMYDGYYPIDDKSYLEILPRNGVLRFNQSNLFNNQVDNRMKRIFYGGLDRRGGVCFLQGSLTLSSPPEDFDDAIARLFYFIDNFVSCLGLKLLPVNLEGYRTEHNILKGGTERDCSVKP